MRKTNDAAATRRDLAAELQAAGLRKSKSRLALLRSMRAELPPHFTVHDLREAVRSQRLKASLATVYNCLNDFTRAGLLTRISAPTGELYYDTRCDRHHHVFIEERMELLEIEDSDVEIHADGTIKIPPRHLRHESGRIELLVIIKKE